MEMKEMLYRRKSTRSYTNEPVDDVALHKIRTFSTKMRPLYPDIKVRSEIVSSDSVKCILPWTTPQLVAIFGEDKEGMPENVGFLYQQLDLYMQTLGLGVCWLGMGRLDPKSDQVPKGDDGMEFVMLLAFGHPKGEALRSSTDEFKRKRLAEISDQEDQRLKPAQFAPSSVNSQPWYFTHEGDVIHAYCALTGLFRKKSTSRINLIDMGIALAQLYVANENTFRFFKADTPNEVKGYRYVGSFTL